ncbi:glutamate decarboxylase [Leifsonia sp. AG29]|uniref:glutamate decarboxylase n=1 Tax=Leifsonia sp. AG29 TaxID=2598860 RepID=UPI00131B0332|nr:glutamate decarboxylase [Leifsonia sp. AG29]
MTTPENTAGPAAAGAARSASAFPAPDAPAYTGRLSRRRPPDSLPDEPTDPGSVYRLIHDELLLDGSSRLNMATFVTTWMEEPAALLMAEAFDKNMIDKDEYPATAAIENRCVKIVSELFHAEPGQPTGASTIGSSEAVMLAGLALKWRWRARRGLTSGGTPNLVLGSNVQVVWEKFCRYFEVEPRYLPMAEGRYIITPEQVAEAVDDDTIGVVGIVGTTFTGELEPIAEICAALDRVAAAGGPDVPVHVDAASGGFVVPFLHPDLEWDFRLPRVVSINVSGHKYGLVYPGIGFVVWRSPEHLPDDLVFRVNYLGGDMPTFTLNFSRPGNQLVGQYYNFVRLGRAGYTAIMEALRDNAKHIADGLKAMDVFDVITDGSAIPVVAFSMRGDPGYTVFHVSHELRARGWQVPAYTMPPDVEELAVLRIVVRDGFNIDLADHLLSDIREVCDALTKQEGALVKRTHFAH